MKNSLLLVLRFSRLAMAIIMALGLFNSQVMASENTSLRVIYYGHQDVDQVTLMQTLKGQLTQTDKIEYLRKMRSSGHVLRLISKDEQSLNQLMQTIKHLPLTRLLEADSIIKIQ